MTSLLSSSKPEEIEEKYVHEVYNAIASHFNKTRYSVWKKVKSYIQTLPDSTIIGEIGCGNGKNMQLKPKQFIGCDQSENMVKLCQQKGLNAIKANIIDLPFKDETFDHTICIAVIHHLASHERRLKAIKEIIRITKTGGSMMILVWALEQSPADTVFKEQDTLVEWHNGPQISERYYHVFKKGELEELIALCTEVEIIESFYEMSNWGIIIKKLR